MGGDAGGYRLSSGCEGQGRRASRRAGGKRAGGTAESSEGGGSNGGVCSRGGQLPCDLTVPEMGNREESLWLLED